MMILLIILGFLIAILGFVGCIFPVIPGPLLGYLSLFIISYINNWESFSVSFLIIMGVLMVCVSLFDNVLPVSGAKIYGASRSGIRGSVLGMVLGMLSFPPVGIIIGAFLGALIGELLENKSGKEAFSASWGVFVGVIMGIGIKLAYCGVTLFFYVKEIFKP